MYPYIDLGPWHISTYTVTATLALTLVTGLYIYPRLLKLGRPPGLITWCILIAAMGGFASAYAARIAITLWHRLQSGPLAPAAGFSVIWAAVGVYAAALYCAWRYRLPLGRTLDLAVVPVPLGQAIGRLGCFARGCCGGRPTDSWLSIYMPNTQGVWAHRYPTQLMSLAANLLIFLILLLVERYGQKRPDKPPGARIWPFDGFLVLLYMELFGIKRFFIAFLREGATPVLGPLSWIQLHAILLMAFATTLILWNRNRRKEEAS
ncbi:MAG: hypothetical protein GXP39_01795 [Chloroflexi bacterium]|nr:hypothetical protein [Chloroflexota bacterium]